MCLLKRLADLGQNINGAAGRSGTKLTDQVGQTKTRQVFQYVLESSVQIDFPHPPFTQLLTKLVLSQTSNVLQFGLKIVQ